MGYFSHFRDLVLYWRVYSFCYIVSEEFCSSWQRRPGLCSLHHHKRETAIKTGRSQGQIIPESHPQAVPPPARPHRLAFPERPQMENQAYNTIALGALHTVAECIPVVSSGKARTEELPCLHGRGGSEWWQCCAEESRSSHSSWRKTYITAEIGTSRGSVRKDGRQRDDLFWLQYSQVTTWYECYLKKFLFLN